MSEIEQVGWYCPMCPPCDDVHARKHCDEELPIFLFLDVPEEDE